MRQLIKTLGLMSAGVWVTLVSGAAGVVSVSACSGGGSGGGLSRHDGGTGGGGGTVTSEAFNLFVLDGEARGIEHFAMAVDPGTKRVGVAYFTPAGTEAIQGHPDFNLQYVEWNDGVVGTPEKIRVVQRRIGLSLAFDPVTHEPVIAFLGGDSGFVVGMSIFWFQSDASLLRKTGGAWVDSVLAVDSAPPTCSSIDQGYLVGLWSQVVFDSTGKAYVLYRDGHNGQFPQQDWAASDIEVIEGTGTPAMRSCLTGDHKQAYGGRIRAIIGANDQPAIVYDQAFGGADVTGQNVLFQKRVVGAGGVASWTQPASLLTISNTMTGASLAYDATEGYGIAVTDRGNSQLKYIRADTGSNDWTVPDEVYGSGTGGWYPSLAMDPVNHEPAVAFYVCSPKTAVQETDCLQDEDELRVSQRTGGRWRETVVDTAGGWAPKLAFFAGDGKRVVVYRAPPALDPSAVVNPKQGVLKLAVEK